MCIGRLLNGRNLNKQFGRVLNHLVHSTQENFNFSQFYNLLASRTKYMTTFTHRQSVWLNLIFKTHKELIYKESEGQEYLDTRMIPNILRIEKKISTMTRSFRDLNQLILAFTRKTDLEKVPFSHLVLITSFLFSANIMTPDIITRLPNTFFTNNYNNLTKNMVIGFRLMHDTEPCEELLEASSAYISEC